MNDYEEITEINVGGTGPSIKVDDELSCSCIYKVIYLHGGWNPDTKKQINDYKHNTFSYSIVPNENCIIHRNDAIQR